MNSPRCQATGLVVLAALAVCGPAVAQVERVPVILDTDAGPEVDDAFALALILGSPELELVGVTTVGQDADSRALIVSRFLTGCGRRNTSIAAGPGPQPARDLGDLVQYARHPDPVFNRTRRPEKDGAVEFLHAQLKARQGKVTILAAGPLTNVARLLADKPDCKPWIKRIVFVGGSLKVAEDNVKADIPAARAVLASGVPLLVVPLDATAGLSLDKDELERVFSTGTALISQVKALYQLSDRARPILASPLAAALCFDERFGTAEQARLEVDDRGVLRTAKGEANARVVTAAKRDDFLKWYVARMADLVPPSRRPAKFVERGGMPNRVLVAEDYETDIEKRWWMSGKAETKNVPPGSTRACRGVLTHDFDDLLGNPRAMYTAVVFNPVPGPPMGKAPRLSFRYWLKGTDTLRVQLYTLSNGYHRHLVLTGLPQGQWESGTVDMTVARRADGTGGPLSENERIDDIQFYTDPSAELLIDDVVLYDAAPEGEKRPFPKRIHFTGWFDSGKQGKEWPGTFEIAQGKGRVGHAARSVPDAVGGAPGIRLHLRGQRPLGDATHLSFRYHLTGSDTIRVALVNAARKTSHEVDLKNLKKEEWAERSLEFRGPKAGEKVDELHFLLPKGAELLLDDLLLYEPGEAGKK